MADANDPTATVKRMFAAFGARDLDALLETVHPESRWTYVGANPELSRAEFTGHAKVRRFFERILERLDFEGRSRCLKHEPGKLYSSRPVLFVIWKIGFLPLLPTQNPRWNFNKSGKFFSGAFG
jgi:hypothetical protein